MTRVLRSKKLRAALWQAANGKCQRCGAELPDDWHADHVKPWSVTGQTNVHEMQALCPACNLRKGATLNDRKHQADLREAIKPISSDLLPLRILAWVVPGGGKSRLPGIIAERFPQYKIGWFVPRLTLQEQAVSAIKADFGITLRDAGNDINPSRGSRGFVATHMALMENPALWRDEFARQQYVLVFDELHHAKLNRDETSRPLAAALRQIRAPIALLMTGTVETSDAAMIFGAEYQETEAGFKIQPEESADIYIRYDRKTALTERAIVPIEFHRHDGPVRWKRGTENEEEERLSEVKREDEAAAIHTALRTDLATQLFESGLDHWRRHAKGGKLIVVTDKQSVAREYERKLKSVGVKTALAIDENPDAHQQVRNFRYDDGVLALVTCQMTYEGLDAPRASHAICLTHIRSAPWIEQMLARIWRAAPGKRQCWAFMPDDPRMNRVIKRIADEQPAVIPEWMEGAERKLNGTAPEPILALDGTVDRISQEYLDNLFAEYSHTDDAKSKILDIIRALGFSGNEPEVQALFKRLSQPRIPPAPEPTPKEKETLLRKQIAEEARQIDGAWARKQNREPAFGRTQQELVKRTGKLIGDMTFEELKRAHTTLQSLRPR